MMEQVDDTILFPHLSAENGFLEGLYSLERVGILQLSLEVFDTGRSKATLFHINQVGALQHIIVSIEDECKVSEPEAKIWNGRTDHVFLGFSVSLEIFVWTHKFVQHIEVFHDLIRQRCPRSLEPAH